MKTNNTKKHDNSFRQFYSSPEMNVINIGAGKVICTSTNATTETETFLGETTFTW